MLGMVENISGNVRIDNVDITKLDINNVRRNEFNIFLNILMKIEIFVKTFG